ncbi:Uncharacterised protein [Escherichia coli]|nr:Uncharacterised protein [Escherichia coli]
MARKIPEFTAKSLIVLDGDVVHDNSANAKKAKKEKKLMFASKHLTSRPNDFLSFYIIYHLMMHIGKIKINLQNLFL